MTNTADIKNLNNQKEVLFMKLSKLSTQKSLTMSTTWYIFAGWLL